MKKEVASVKLLAVMVALLIVAGTLCATDQNYSVGVFVDPISTINFFIVGGMGLAGGAEFKISPQGAVSVEGSFFTASTDYLGATIKFSGFSVQGMYHHYFMKALTGPYLAVGGGYYSANVQVEGYPAKITLSGPSLGAIVGYKLNLMNFYIDPFVGFSHLFGTWSTTGFEDLDLPAISSGGFVWGIYLGFQF